LIKIRSVICNSCHTVFRIKNNNLKLVKIVAQNSPIWQEYQKQLLTPREWNIIGKGGMSDVKQHVADRVQWFGELKSGKINFTFIQANTPVILKNNEKVYCAISNVILKEPRAVRVTRGGYAGPSVRIAKGISFHLGSFGSSSQSHQEIKTIDKGVLTLTNQRLIFSGAMKTISISIDKIVQIDPFTDGISLHKEGREKTQYFLWGKNISQIKLVINNRSYPEAFSGLIFEFLVEGLRKYNLYSQYNN
jgi:hypothetical protein